MKVYIDVVSVIVSVPGSGERYELVGTVRKVGTGRKVAECEGAVSPYMAMSSARKLAIRSGWEVV